VQSVLPQQKKKKMKMKIWSKFPNSKNDGKKSVASFCAIFCGGRLKV